MEGLAPSGSDAEIIDDMALQLDLNVDWSQIRKMLAKKVDSKKGDSRGQRGSNLDAQRQMEDVDRSTFNLEQHFRSNVIQQTMDSHT